MGMMSFAGIDRTLEGLELSKWKPPYCVGMCVFVCMNVCAQMCLCRCLSICVHVCMSVGVHMHVCARVRDIHFLHRYWRVALRTHCGQGC